MEDDEGKKGDSGDYPSLQRNRPYLVHNALCSVLRANNTTSGHSEMDLDITREV